MAQELLREGVAEGDVLKLQIVGLVEIEVAVVKSLPVGNRETRISRGRVCPRIPRIIRVIEIVVVGNVLPMVC